MMKKIIASLLTLSMAGTGIMAVNAEESNEATEVTPRYLDISNYMDSDLIGLEGETVGENWLKGLSATDNFAGLVGDNLPSDGYINSYIYTPGTDTSARWSTATKTTDYITAYINPDKYAAGVNDAIYIPGDRSDVTINLSGEISEKIYVFMQGTSSYNKMAYTLTYSDGTTKTESNMNSNTAHNVWYDPISATPRVISFSESYKRAEVVDSKITEGSTVRMMYALAIDVDTTKKAKSLTLKVYNENNDQGYFVYAITEEPVGNEKLTSYINETLKLEDIETPEDREKVNLSLEYAAILSERGDVNAAQYTASLNKLIKKADSDKTKYLDLTSYMDADLIAKNGETVGENWLKGLPATSNFAGIVGDNLPSSGYINSYIYTPGSDGTQNWNTAEKSTTEYVTAYIDPAKYAAGINDAVYIPGDRSDVTIDLTGRMTEKLYVFMQGSSSYNKMAYTITYSDGTVTTESDHNSSAAQNILYNPINSTPRVTAFSENYKRAEVDAETSKVSEGSTVKLMYVLSLPVDREKKAEKLTLKVYNENNDQGYFVYAITEEPVKNSVLESYIDAVAKKDIITDSDKQELQKALFYAEELDQRGAVDYEDSMETLKKQITQSNTEFIGYADLSASFNIDVIGKAGENVNEDYLNGYEVERYFGVINAEKFPADGMLSIGKIDVDSIEDVTQNWNTVMSSTKGTVTAKLDADLYAGGKDDAVLIDSDYTFNLSGCYTDNIYVFMGTTGTKGGNMTYQLNYSDGTSAIVENLKVTNYQSTRYGKINDYYSVVAMTGGYGNNLLRDENGVLIKGADNSATGVYAIALDVDSEKQVKSVTFKPSTGNDDYFIFAVTEESKTYEELMTEMNACPVDSINDITLLNAPSVIAAANAAIRLDASEIKITNDVAYWNKLKTAAKMVMNGEEIANVLKFTPVITVDENKNASVNVEMINTTESGESYILILAAYGANNKLLTAVIGDEKILEAGTLSEKDGANLSAPAGVIKYKAFIWKNLETIEPIAFDEFEIN